MSKPTGLWTDIPAMADFGHVGWPVLDKQDVYRGPLPRDCGHKHKRRMIGKAKGGGFNTSPTAAYPPGMCEFLARRIFQNFVDHLESPGGGGRPSVRPRVQGSTTTSTTTTTHSSRTTTGASARTSEARPERTSTDYNPGNLNFHVEPASVARVKHATDLADRKGIGTPILEGIDELLDHDRKLGEATIDNDATTDEERELGDFVRPKLNSGFWGIGPTLQPHRKGMAKTFIDGAGLPSPGRWKVANRRLPGTGVAKHLRDILREGLRVAEPSLPGGDLRATLFELAAGKVESDPFPEDLMDDLRLSLRVQLTRSGFGDGLPRKGDVDQVMEVRLMQALLEAFEDPDAHFGHFWARGVWLGSVERKLPRTPALYERKTKWPRDDPELALHGEWQTNYSSLHEHERQVLKQVEEEEKAGMLVRMSLGEALDRYGNDLLIAATGAIAKKGPGGDVRIIFDASNGCHLNQGIKIRDQVRFPTAPDVKATVAAMAEEGGAHFGLLIDVSKAHRRIPVLESEWGRQAFQVRGRAAAAAQALLLARPADGRGHADQPRKLKRSDFSARELAEDVFLNRVGTFGVTSAGYWWGRAAGGVVRLLHYCLGLFDALWILLYSDDGKLTGRTDYPERGLLLALMILSILRLPISWHKVKGGCEFEWIGYWVDIGRFRLGISASRAAWASRWLRDKATEGRVALGELQEGLGRLQFIAGPVEHIRPFLGPLYAWSAAGPRFAKPAFPVMVVLIMRYLAEELARDSMAECTTGLAELGEIFRLDAKAAGQDVAIGGWRTTGGKVAEAEWFAVSLNRVNAPWAFAKGEAFRTIASLELLGALVGLMVLVPEGDRGEAAGTLTLSCGTDNRGNSFLLDKMLTTRYPLGIVLMECAHQMRKRRLLLRANWLPRDQNEEADALTNADYRFFNPKRRIRVDLEKIGFEVLPELFEHGERYLTELEAQRAKAKEEATKRGRRDRGKQKREPLAVKDPWK